MALCMKLEGCSWIFFASKERVIANFPLLVTMCCTAFLVLPRPIGMLKCFREALKPQEAQWVLIEFPPIFLIEKLCC